MSFKVVGQRVKRYDGLSHVTGQTRFVDDVVIPGTLTVKVLRSPVVKGVIRNIDTSTAETLRGVYGVITHKDVPNNGFGLIPDQKVLADHEVRYKGEPIAAVAAVDQDTAFQALEKIKVEIEEQDHVLDPLEAMQPGAPSVRPEGNLFMYDGRPCRRIVFGDIEEGFKQADEIVSGQYIHPSLEHTPLEPQTSLVVPSAEGKLTIYTVSSAQYLHLMMISRIVQLPMNKVRFVGGTVGGNFGGKNDIHADHITSLLALKTGRPVKWAWTREEELLYSTHRGSFHITIEDGVKRDGRLIARRIKSIRDAGAYTSLNAYVVDKYCFHASGPYYIPNVYVEGYCVYTNKPPASAMRGFGVTPATYVSEVQMNKIAARLGMDPWEIRFINAFRNGDPMHTRRVLDSVALIETMQALARKTGVNLPERHMSMTSEKRME